MKTLVCLFVALFGVAAALSPPYSFEYEYQGTIRTGLQEVSNQFSAGILKAKVKVYMPSRSVAYVQILEPEAGTTNDYLWEDGRAPPRVQMTPLKDAAQIQKSFKVSLAGDQEILEVPSGEMLWISNLRKAIASTLRLPFVTSSGPALSVDVATNTFSSQDLDKPRAFQKEEETIYGKCRVGYTISPAAPSSIMQLRTLESDAQQHQQSSSSSSSSRFPPTQDPAYRITRVVDFDHCKDRATVSTASFGNLTESGEGQFRGVQARSSVGEYLVTGRPSGKFSVRVEKAIIEGTITVNPFGHNTHKIFTIANQTIELVSVSSSDQHKVPTPVEPQTPEPWTFRVTSPHRRAQDSPRWVSFQDQSDSYQSIVPEFATTGFRMTPDHARMIKEKIVRVISEMPAKLQRQNLMETSPLGGTQDGQTTQRIADLVPIVNALSKQDLSQVYSQLAGSSSSSQSKEAIIKRSIFLSLLKAAGSAPSIKLLLEKMSSNDLSETEKVATMVTMPANVQSSKIVDDIVDYAKTMNQNSPVSLLSATLLSSAQIVRKACASRALRRYDLPAPMLGQAWCDRQTKVREFVQHVAQLVKNSETKHVKAIGVIALSRVGSSESLIALRNIIQDSENQISETIKVMAIESINGRYLENTTYSQAYNVLLPIAEDHLLEPEVREAAVMSLLTLPKNATFWQRMAVATWREPSTRVASFIYNAIVTMANSRNAAYLSDISMAKQALPLSKPMPRSAYFSARFFFSKYRVHEDMAGETVMQFLSNGRSWVPKQIDFRTAARLGGIKLPIAGISMYGTNIEEKVNQIWNIITAGPFSDSPSSSLRSSDPRDRRHRETHAKYQEAARGHEFESSLRSSEEQERQLHIIMSVLGSQQIFAPITWQSMQDINDPNKSLVGHVLHKLQSNQPMTGLLYSNPVQIVQALPTEIGLPVITKVSNPTLLYSDLHARVEADSPQPASIAEMYKAKKVNMTGTANTKIILKRENSMMVLVPWTNQSLVSGVDGETSFSMPADFFAAVDRRTQQPTFFQFGIKPKLQSQSPIMMVKSKPMTIVRDMFPEMSSQRHGATAEASYKPVHIHQTRKPFYKVDQHFSKQLTGVSAKLKFEGDTEYPLNYTTIMKVIRNPGRVFSLLVTTTARHSQIAMIVDPQQSETQQVVATINSVNVHPRAASSSSPRDGSDAIPNLSPDDTMEQRISKLQQSAPQVQAMYSASLNFSGPSSAPRKFEIAILSKLERPANPQYRQKSVWQINLMRNQRTSSLGQLQQTCATVDLEYPRIDTYTTMEQLLGEQEQGHLKTTLRSKIYAGQQCDQASKYFQIEGEEDVSAERRDFIKSHDSLQQTYKPYNPTDAIKDALVYDRLEMKIHQTQMAKDPSSTVRNLTLQFSDIVHGYLFPNYLHNYEFRGEPGVVEISAKRDLATDRVTAWAKTPERLCLSRDVKVPAIVDYLSFLNGALRPRPQFPDSNSSSISSGSGGFQLGLMSPRQSCVVSPTGVQTFAGATYRKLSTKCDTIAVKSHSTSEEDKVILTLKSSADFSQEQEAGIIYPAEGVTLRVTKEGIFVNGQRVPREQKELKKPGSNTPYAKVYQNPESNKVKLSNKFSVEVKEGKHIIIKMSDKYRSRTMGLCGRFTPETLGDLRDSSGCLYRPADQGEMYGLAWLTRSALSQCLPSAAEEIKQRAREDAAFQSNCPKTLQEQGRRRAPRRAPRRA